MILRFLVYFYVNHLLKRISMIFMFYLRAIYLSFSYQCMVQLVMLIMKFPSSVYVFTLFLRLLMLWFIAIYEWFLHVMLLAVFCLFVVYLALFIIILSLSVLVHIVKWNIILRASKRRRKLFDLISENNTFSSKMLYL